MFQKLLTGESRGGDTPSGWGLGVTPRFFLIPLSLGKVERDHEPVLSLPKRTVRVFEMSSSFVEVW